MSRASHVEAEISDRTRQVDDQDEARGIASSAPFKSRSPPSQNPRLTFRLRTSNNEPVLKYFPHSCHRSIRQLEKSPQHSRTLGTLGKPTRRGDSSITASAAKLFDMAVNLNDLDKFEPSKSGAYDPGAIRVFYDNRTFKGFDDKLPMWQSYYLDGLSRMSWTSVWPVDDLMPGFIRLVFYTVCSGYVAPDSVTFANLTLSTRGIEVRKTFHFTKPWLSKTCLTLYQPKVSDP